LQKRSTAIFEQGKLLCNRSPLWKKDNVLGSPDRLNIAFFGESSTPVTYDIILRTSAIFSKNKRIFPRTNAIILNNKRHHLEEKTERADPPSGLILGT
jgi:hypothetical protein